MIGIVLIAVSLTRMAERNRKKVITSSDSFASKVENHQEFDSIENPATKSAQSHRNLDDRANRVVVVNPMLQSSKREVVDEVRAPSEPRELAPMPVYEIEVNDGV